MVVDASVLVAALVDGGPVGTWAADVFDADVLAAPHVLPVELTNILRRAAQAGDITDESASLAHHDMLGFRIELFPYEPLAERIWELRRNLTSYDAWYVGLAEALDAPLVTLDLRLTRAPGPRCRFVVPG